MWKVGSFVHLQRKGSSDAIGGFMLLNPDQKGAHVFAPVPGWNPGGQNGLPEAITKLVEQLNK